MPFLRTPKGTKINFSQARLSALLSLVYLEAFSDKTPRYRNDIQQHCQRIWVHLEELYGDQETDEWPGAGIQKSIDDELKLRAAQEVHEAFLSMKINEFHSPINTEFKKTSWNKFEAKPQNFQVLDQEKLDPAWAILVQKQQFAGLQKKIEQTVSQTLSEKLGVMARMKPEKKEHESLYHQISARRSHWISFWKNLPKKNIPWHTWERYILQLTPDQQTKTIQDWWLWWQGHIDEALKKDPQLYELRRALYERKKRGELIGQSWLEGTALSPDSTFRLEISPTGHAWYRRLGVEFLKRIFQPHFSHIEWDWTLIQRSFIPENDSLITWKAWQHMDDSGALRPLEGIAWAQGDIPHADAKEMPQWAWMRLAMALSLYDPEPFSRTQNAIELYQRLSRLQIIPSAAAVREAGQLEPRFFEDHTWVVPDQFEPIQKVIYSAAIETTWTGTSASNWGKVRSKNAPVRSGRRKSTGVNDFLRTIDSHLKAQGRVGEDRPVTNMLPIWHLDVEEFIHLRHDSGQRLQPVVLLSDLFMQRVTENGTWTLFDPYIFPEVANSEKDGYLAAEASIAERKKNTHNLIKWCLLKNYGKKFSIIHA